MGKYFGTDGFRGEANVTLTVEHAFKVGRFLGWFFGQDGKCKVAIGKDTRRSSYMFEYSLVAGLTASGADAYLLHVTTTPSVSYVVRTEDFDCGIMISASHNPYYDNGIKLINSQGEKMDEETILQIEDYIDGKPRTVIERTATDAENEFIMLSLRLDEGLPFKKFKELFGIDFANVGIDAPRDGNCRGVGSTATERGYVAVLIDALKACNDCNIAVFQRFENSCAIHADDLRLVMRIVGNDAGLASRERHGAVAARLYGHGQKRHGHLLTSGKQSIHLACGRIAVDSCRQAHELVGGLAHGRHNSNDLMAFLPARNKALCNIANALGRRNRRPTELANNQ